MATATERHKVVDKKTIELTIDAEERQEIATPAELDDQGSNVRLDLLYEVGKKVGSVSQVAQLVEQSTQMTQRTLKAEASSVLLYDDQERELLFKVAQGQASSRLRKLKLSPQYGIAGWVARTGKPIIINDVGQDERFDKGVDKITGFVTRSMMCAPLVVNRKTIGVIQVLNKADGSGFSEYELEALVSVAGTVAMAIECTRLHQRELQTYKSTVKALVAAIDAKDPYTRGHSQRVTEYALLGASALSLPPDEQEVLECAAILHDIGKIGIPDKILRKASPLTNDEWDMVRKHPLIGANILKEIPFLEKASKLVLHHHERYDGAGYPYGLRGEDIPIGARLLVVADAFDSMTTGRSYRAAMSIEHTLEELHQLCGTQFCPVAVEAFISGLKMDASTGHSLHQKLQYSQPAGVR